jgi:CheY-like chemotaxis protein
MTEHAETKPTALVIDNDLLILMGTAHMMRELGYAVQSTAQIDEAIAAFEGPNPPDMLITDYSMPKMIGVDLAHRILSIRPETRVLLITGHDMIDGLPEGWGILTKPFSENELMLALDRGGVR